MLPGFTLRKTLLGIAMLALTPAFLAADTSCVPVVPRQLVYVISGTKVVAFESNGALFTEFGSAGSGPGQFQLPSGIAMEAGSFGFVTNELYITDAVLNRVQKFDTCGNLLLQFGSTGSGPGALYKPYGITVDYNSNIWVADTGNNRIQVFSSSGAFLMQIGGLGGGNGQFNAPVGISFAGDRFGASRTGTLYVADTGNNRIQAFTITYAPVGGSLAPVSVAFSQKFGSFGSGSGQFNGPFGVTYDNTGNLWVADSQNQRIQKFTPAGAFLQAVGPFSFPSPYGIARDAAGASIWTVDYNTNKVMQFDLSGARLATFGTTGGGPGQLFHPTYIAVGIPF